MKYAIVEKGGKQYRAVEGETIDVDRLPDEAGKKVALERVLMVVDGDEIRIGTPTVSGLKVNTTVVEHFKGPKIVVFKYSPRKRIRVKRGHRQQYTRLLVDAIGSGPKAEKKAEPKAEKPAPAAKKAAAKKTAKKAAAKKTAPKAAAKKTAPKKTTAKKSTAKKTAAKKTAAKKTAAKKTSSKKSTKK